MSSNKSFFLRYEGFIEPELFFKEMMDLFNLKNKKIKWMVWGYSFDEDYGTYVFLKINKKVKIDSPGPLSILSYGERLTPRVFYSRKQTEILLFLKKKMDSYSQYNFNLEEYLKKKKNLKKK